MWVKPPLSIKAAHFLKCRVRHSYYNPKRSVLLNCCISKYGNKPQKLPDLPGAKTEAFSIAPILNTKALTGDQATKAAVLSRISQAKVIHLATHGLYDDFQGLQSSIALAPTSKDNGLLTAEEILNLNLNADLVVLSACNTGRGRITGSGGYWTIARVY